MIAGMTAAPGGARLGEILVEIAGLSPADLARGLALARSEKVRLGTALIALGLASSDDVATALAQQQGVVAARDKHLDSIVAETRALVPAKIAQRLCAIPVGVVRGEPPELVVAMRDPLDQAAIDELARVTGYRIRPAVASEGRLRDLVDALKDEPAVQAPRPKSPSQMPMIDITPVPAALPAPLLPASFGPALEPAEEIPLPDPSRIPTPAPHASRDVIVSTNDLELVDVPRARRLSQQPTLGAQPSRLPPVVAKAAPVGGAILDEKPSGGGVGIPKILVQLLGLGVAIAVGYVAYQWSQGAFSDDEPITGPAVHGQFHSDRLGVTMRLTGSWHESPDGIGAGKLPMMGDSTRADAFLRGDSATHPDKALIIMRVTQAGAFAQVDHDNFMTLLRSMEEGSSQMSNEMFTLDGKLACRESSLGASPLGICSGKGEVLSTDYDIDFFLWMPTADDALIAVWFDRDRDETEAMALVRSIQLD